ncbi:MAG: hypothetical protein IIC63_00255 [Proteobacteria bacterium]|nr:hypothetical protein [Pseudomonadota bacterium]
MQAPTKSSDLHTTKLAAFLVIFIACLFVIDQARATETATTRPADHAGQVTLPLDKYQQLLQQVSALPLPAPSAYAVGQSVLSIVFHQRDGHVTATVQAQVEVETFEDEWTLVALLSPGAALESARINGAPVQLVQRSEGLFWLAEKRQKATVHLTYHVDSHFVDRAYITNLPIPRAAATRFTLQIPQTHIDLAVAPVANLVTSETATGTTANGTVSSTQSMMVSWRVAVEREYVLSRADYRGALQGSTQASIRGSSIAWHTTIEAEMLIDGEVMVPLVSTATTLLAVKVDGKPATVYSEEGRFAVRLAGAGKHLIDLSFLSPVTYPDGVPSTSFDIPNVPVSKFELTLEGDKLVQANAQAGPAVSVDISNKNGATVARFFIPMSTRLALNWMEAIPDDVAVERRANAVVYQALYAGEGVLYGLAAIRYEITRGDAIALEFSIPASALVNHITSPAAAIADWIIVEGEAAEPDGDTHIRVFLNRAVTGEFILNVAYEQLLEDSIENGGQEAGASPKLIHVPILRALGVARQKGMVALLSGPDLALAPVEHPDMSEVGENQLPAFFRNQLEQTVSHTYKYHSAASRLVVNTVTPERQQGKFNAQIDTLISISEVTLKGQVSIENDVKSGVLRELRLTLPADVNILGVSGPSIRNHTITLEGDLQHVNIEFTREMDGLFRIELNYERIMLDGAAQTTVPRLEVVDADVEHGRIAIEALSVLEVQASRVEQLSSLEINELPRQLVLKTTNPILLAYRYVRTEKPFELQLRITRHEEIDVQVAAIDMAYYQTLFTTDGLAVTRVQFDVRNSRRQFLRLTLPPDSEIWSVFVNGHAQKPAFAPGTQAGSKDLPGDILIKMVNSATAFPVELVYATRGAAMRNFGRIQGSLPRPDMIVTHTNWDVYVPAAPRYGEPRTNMEILAARVITSVTDTSIELLRGAVANVISGEPLHIELPTQGLLYRFSKLYANQSQEDAQFTMRYVNRSAGFAGLWISLLATLAIWAGIVLMAMNVRGPSALQNLPLYIPWTLLGAGAALTALSMSVLGASVIPPSILSLAIAVALGGWQSWQWWQKVSP